MVILLNVIGGIIAAIIFAILIILLRQWYPSSKRMGDWIRTSHKIIDRVELLNRFLLVV